jgi:eukaryotic-like serine/threonine-protein kinase
MGEKNSSSQSDQENPKKREDAEGAHIGAAGASTCAETTVDTAGRGAEAGSMAEGRISIGPYLLIQKLGEGGMGQVWLAEQTAPVKRQVALKLIKSGLYDSAVIQRFESERQSLAVMNHPAIAKVFDAGSTKDGQPYFVMEYVDGLPITKYCDAKRLKVRERLELFIKVCEGVQHAHQKAIIHRDLKPSNVLVVEVDGKPMPRIIDFGLAKAISPQPAAEQTLFTQMGAMIGTRGFMSPEQADPGVQDVDTRTDVYSLGVTLYVLLTGTLPFDQEQWKRKPFDEVLRQLREEDPPSPSTKLIEEEETARDSSKKRATEPGQLVALLRGDLDWITLRALEKDRARRYGTPSELAADIERHLQNRPIVARPASSGYRVRKYFQRHRVGVAVASGVAALLVAFAAAQTVQLRRTTVERDRATHERDRANRISAFMTSMFKVSDPNEARGNSITVREILDKSSKEIETGLAQDPELQVQLMGTMGEVYSNLGLFPQAQAMLEHSVETARRTGRSENPETLRARSHLCFLLLRQGRYSEAETVAREAIPAQYRVLGPNDMTTLTTRRLLAAVLEFEGKFAEADRVGREALNASRNALGPENPETLRAMNVLANILDDEKLIRDAEQLYRETLAIQVRTLGPDAPETLTTASNLAGALQEQGRLDEAEKLQRETLATRSRVLGPEHPDTLATKSNLGNTLDSAGRFSEAEALYREVLDSQSRVLGKDNPDTLTAAANFGATLRRAGNLPEAEKIQRQTLEAKRRVLGPNHPETIKTLFDLATTLFVEGKLDEARKIYNDRVEAFRQKSDRPGVAGALYDFACGAAIAGHTDEAFGLLRQSIDEGYMDFDNMQGDRDLSSLHRDPRFGVLLKEVKQRAKDAPAH